MSPARRRALMFLLLAAVVAAALAIAWRTRAPESGQRPRLLLLTSLPLMFGEDFSLQGGGSRALKALQGQYEVVPISVTDPKELAKGRLLLMAHPRAQPAEDLVALDDWVRAGGRVLLLADPMLEWPSERPLGDPTRPPPMFMDTGLLAHWGLRIAPLAERGDRNAKLGGYEVLSPSPGRLSGSCAIAADRLIAHCGIGKGSATVVADADLLDVERLGPKAAHNLDGLLAELASLERE